LGDDINYAKAQIYFSQGKYAEAEAMYKNILEYTPGVWDDLVSVNLTAVFELSQAAARIMNGFGLPT